MAHRDYDYSQYEHSEYEKYTARWKGCSDLRPALFHNLVRYLPEQKSFSVLVDDFYENKSMDGYYEELGRSDATKEEQFLSEEEAAEQRERIQAVRSRFIDTFDIADAPPFFGTGMDERVNNYFSGTRILVPLGEGILNFCYTDFHPAFEVGEPLYYFFSKEFRDRLRCNDPSAGKDELVQEIREQFNIVPDDLPDEPPPRQIRNCTEDILDTYERYINVFSILNDVFYSSLYTAIFPPLFLKRTDYALWYYKQYIKLLQEEFLELIEFCFDERFHPEALGRLYPSERYGLWCRIKDRSSTSKRKEVFHAASRPNSGKAMPFGMPTDELIQRVQTSVTLTDAQKEFAKEYGLEEDSLAIYYRFPSFIHTAYECSTVRDMLYLEFTKMLEEGIRFQKCGRCGKYFIQKGNYHGSYCDRTAPGERRSCQQLAAQEAYQKKLSGNDGNNPLSVYQKYYKRYFARVKAGSLKKDAFKQWQYEAVTKRGACLDGELSLDELIAWMEGSFPNRVKKEQ